MTSHLRAPESKLDKRLRAQAQIEDWQYEHKTLLQTVRVLVLVCIQLGLPYWLYRKEGSLRTAIVIALLIGVLWIGPLVANILDED